MALDDDTTRTASRKGLRRRYEEIYPSNTAQLRSKTSSLKVPQWPCCSMDKLSIVLLNVNTH